MSSGNPFDKFCFLEGGGTETRTGQSDERAAATEMDEEFPSQMDTKGDLEPLSESVCRHIRLS